MTVVRNVLPVLAALHKGEKALSQQEMTCCGFLATVRWINSPGASLLELPLIGR
jgi:hypothetical protein